VITRILSTSLKQDKMRYFYVFCIAIGLAVLPFIYGPLRKGFRNIIISIFFTALYFLLFFSIQLWTSSNRMKIELNDRQINDTSNDSADSSIVDTLRTGDNILINGKNYVVDSLKNNGDIMLSEKLHASPPFIIFSLPLEWVFAVLVIGIILFTLIIYFIERKKKIDDLPEEFYDERLFYKYGQLIKSSFIPIGLIDEISLNNADKIINELIEYVKLNLDEKFSNASSYYTLCDLHIRDYNKKNDTRNFVRASFVTERNSSFYYFIHIKKIGKQIIVNTSQYIRTYFKWHTVVLFIVTSPLHYWTWVYHWYMSKHSTISTLSSFYQKNSFDNIDLEAYVKSSNFIVLNSIEEFARSHGFLTDELKHVISNNINQIQNIKISKSKWVKLGRIQIISDK